MSESAAFSRYTHGVYKDLNKFTTRILSIIVASYTYY